jgi:uncharacterized protein (DUF305 family)
MTQTMSLHPGSAMVGAGKLFLTQMIRHHRGAISMAQKEIKSGQYLRRLR